MSIMLITHILSLQFSKTYGQMTLTLGTLTNRLNPRGFVTCVIVKPQLLPGLHPTFNNNGGEKKCKQDH